MNYQKIIHDFALATCADWNTVTNTEFAEMIRDAEHANRADIVRALKLRQILTKMHNRGRPNLLVYRTKLQYGSIVCQIIGDKAQWVIGNHTDDYFGTLPKNVVESIHNYLFTRTWDQDGHQRIYFCGQRCA